MKSLKQRLILYLFSFFIIIFVVAIWSTTLLTEWSVDYGVYYAGSYFLDENYNLYKEFFTHKGPIYYLFLQIIGYIIGWGSWQAYLSLVLSILVFYLPVFFILVSERLKAMTFFAATLLSLCLLYGQDSNASISFFQSGFLFTSFWLLAKHGKNLMRLNISFILLSCAILTRIDAVIYLPIYLFAIIFTSNSISIIAFFRKISIWFIIFTFLFFAFAYNFNFNLNDYLVHNIEFNKWYGVKLSSCHSLPCTFANYLNRPGSYDLITGSLIIMPILSLVPELRSGIYEIILNIKNIFKDINIKNPMSSNAYALIIVFISITAWFFTASDRNYHLLIALVPLLFIYIINFRIFTFGQSSFIILVAGYCLLIVSFSPLYKIYKDPECLYSPFCVSSKLQKQIDSIDFLRNLPDEEVTIVGGYGWVYFYSNKKPARSINDTWLYAFDNSFLTPGLARQHDKLLQMLPGQKFLIKNELIDRVNNKNQLLDQTLRKAEQVNQQFEYSVFKIK
jgi:hypothetical protein